MKRSYNVYDDPIFFEGYKKLRDNPDNANNLEEKPALFSLSPCLSGKSILDLGCGDGENCVWFSEMGAKFVLGIDISEKMLQVAQTENPHIQFAVVDMNDLSSVEGTFDAIFSSLAVHYIEDFNRLITSIFNLLNDDGYFIFSQEHPLTTAPIEGAAWNRNEDGSIHYKLTDYAIPGCRKTHWIIDGVVKYHRTFSSIVNALTCNGFIIEKMLEPAPEQDTIERLPSFKKNMHKPNFLLVKAKKRRAQQY